MPVITPKTAIHMRPGDCHVKGCRYQSPSQSNLKWHYFLNHTDWFFQPFLCTSCQRGYGSESRLQQHLGRGVHKVNRGKGQGILNPRVLHQEFIVKGSFTPEWAAQLRYWAKQPFTTEEGSATESLASSPTRAPDSGSSRDSSNVRSVQQEEPAAISGVDHPGTDEPSWTQESANCGQR